MAAVVPKDTVHGGGYIVVPILLATADADFGRVILRGLERLAPRIRSLVTLVHPELAVFREAEVVIVDGDALLEFALREGLRRTRLERAGPELMVVWNGAGHARILRELLYRSGADHVLAVSEKTGIEGLCRRLDRRLEAPAPEALLRDAVPPVRDELAQFIALHCMRQAPWPVTTTAIARRFGYSRRGLTELLQRLTGKTPHIWVSRGKLLHARSLRALGMTLQRTAHLLSYADASGVANLEARWRYRDF